jgi:hypothetical protein
VTAAPGITLTRIECGFHQRSSSSHASSVPFAPSQASPSASAALTASACSARRVRVDPAAAGGPPLPQEAATSQLMRLALEQRYLAPRRMREQDPRLHDCSSWTPRRPRPARAAMGRRPLATPTGRSGGAAARDRFGHKAVVSRSATRCPPWTRRRRTHGAQSDARLRRRMQECTPRGRRSRDSFISNAY